MQIKNNRSNYLQKSWIIGLVKLFLVMGCLYFIYLKLTDRSISLDDVELPSSFNSIIISVLCLMIVNWFLEALRWKTSIEQFEQMTLKESLKTILIGLSLNWVLPFTSGDLIARIANNQDKYQSTSATVLNRGIMMIITVIYGLYGASFIMKIYNLNGWILVSLLLVGVLMLFAFRRFIDRFLTYFKEISFNRILKVVGISIVRYAVFVFQFYLLLWAFLPSIESHVLVAGIGWIFIVRSSLPLFLGGVGVREASGLMFFESYTNNLAFVITPIFLIWVVNTVIPSLIGLLLVLNSKKLISK